MCVIYGNLIGRLYRTQAIAIMSTHPKRKISLVFCSFFFRSLNRYAALNQLSDDTTFDGAVTAYKAFINTPGSTLYQP